MQPRCRQYGQMLQVALAPAAVACGEIEQRRRALLVAAAEFRRHVDGPPGTPHEGGLDEVVAEDMAAKRLASGQFRQASIVRKGTNPDNGVVAPVVAF